MRATSQCVRLAARADRHRLILAFSGDGYLSFPPSRIVAMVRPFLGKSAMAACTVSSCSSRHRLRRSHDDRLLPPMHSSRGVMRAKKLLLSLMLPHHRSPYDHGDRDVLFCRAAGADRQFLWLGLCHATVAMPIVLLILLSSLQAVDQIWSAPRSASAAAGSGVFVVGRDSARIARHPSSAALFAFLASFDELSSRCFSPACARRHCRCASGTACNLQVEPIIAAVSAFLIAVTCIILAIDGILRHQRGQRRLRAPT